MKYVLIILALLGITAASLALREKYRPYGESVCDINDHWDCGIVNHSPYAEIKQVPVAAIGMGGYLAIALLALVKRRWLVAGGAIIGLAFSLYLTHIEKDVLQVWCLYCVISLGVISVIALLSVIWAFVGQFREQEAL